MIVTADIGSSAAKKWTKGALIGTGSFGQVFLGMDDSDGTLVAVKQVELPNNEHKMTMLSALEHEIELLLEMQHDNIVQYLCKTIILPLGPDRDPLAL